MASAPYAGAVQCNTRNTAHVAIRVAMAIPDIGLEDVPINPVIREETVTNKNPKITTKTAAARLAYQLVYAPGTGLKVSIAHIITSMAAAPRRAHFISMSWSVRS